MASSQEHEISNPTVAEREAGLLQLEDLYIFRRADEVRRFLTAYLELIEFLLEAYAHLQRHFGPDPQVVLEVVSDPEIEGSEELFTYIRTSLPVDEALARLDSLDEEWFLDQLDQVGRQFNFNLELGTTP